MANGISVERTGLQAGVQVCKTCIHELQSTARSLQNSYRNAGSGWKDENYAKLGGIVDECLEALNEPIPDIEDSMNTLNEMLRIMTLAEEVF